MKKSSIIGISLLILLLLGSIGLLWRRTSTGVTEIQLTGIAGVPVTGYYVQDGRRTHVAAALPWRFEGTNVTKFEFRKVSSSDSFRYEISHSSVGRSFQAGPVGSASVGLRGELGHRSMRLGLIKQGV
jgi:hypothetical protein